VIFVLFVVSLAVRCRLRFDTTKNTKHTKNGLQPKDIDCLLSVFTFVVFPPSSRLRDYGVAGRDLRGFLRPFIVGNALLPRRTRRTGCGTKASIASRLFFLRGLCALDRLLHNYLGPVNPGSRKPFPSSKLERGVT